MTEQLTEEHPAPVAALAGPVPVSWATVPRVNLLPLAIVQGRRFARIKLMLTAVVLAGVALAAAGTYVAARGVSSANDDLTAAQTQVTSLRRDAAKYAAVPQITQAVAAAQAARTMTMSRDVLWYQFLNDLAGALPDGVTQQTVTATLSPVAPGSAATAANPLSVAGIGTLSITGTASQYQEVSAWLDSLAKITGVSSPQLASATQSSDAPSSTVVQYAISGVITDEALSHRYDKEGS